MNRLIVQKYGGTSVGDLERIGRVADRVVRTRQSGADVIVVVSAMAGETDRLAGLGCGLFDAAPREADVVLASGEQVTAGLTAAALIARGIPARSLLGHQLRLLTTDRHGDADVDKVEGGPLREALAAGVTPVVAGFQGVDRWGNITTLGRGGSDTTAVAIAGALQADECEIYTDVDGVYDVDPRRVNGARKLSRIRHGEMLAMARKGAKVLHAKCVELAARHRMTLHVRSTFFDVPGTLVVPDRVTDRAATSRGARSRAGTQPALPPHAQSLADR